MAPGRTPAARLTLWRQRLIDELDRNATERLTCITAPAGYGKTVLLAQWHEARPSAGITFVTCDDRDGDLCHLTCRL
ncbi:MAG: hypothetical protein M1435_03220, partial [Actinobacteria bacterium]|nr:hypothetical protein [Actinomycetota bacterium]